MSPMLTGGQSGFNSAKGQRQKGCSTLQICGMQKSCGENNQPGEVSLPKIPQDHEIRFPLYTQSKEQGNHQQYPQKVLFQDRPQGCNLRSHRNKFRLTKISVRFQRKLEIAKGGHLIPPFFVWSRKWFREQNCHSLTNLRM